MTRMDRPIPKDLETVLLYWSNKAHTLFDEWEDFDNVYRQTIDLEYLMNTMIEQVIENYEGEYEFEEEDIKELHRVIDVRLQSLHNDVEGLYDVIIPLDQSTRPLMVVELKSGHANYSNLRNGLSVVYEATRAETDKILNLVHFNHNVEMFAKLELSIDELEEEKLNHLDKEVNQLLEEQYRRLEIYVDEVEERLSMTKEVWEKAVDYPYFREALESKAEEIVYEE